MTYELYFCAGILFLLSVCAFAKAEKYVEDHVFGAQGSFNVVKNLYRGKMEELDHNSSEFYCFFNKSEFDIK
ncbi:hypothetical protein [Maridesulfovibrio sp. FT414]|uniref:hypothetical protein n=1 Tax=Maridesulfovibrio sp. FT414 TaxID=2979469 RepID=UPI003D801171